MTRVWGGDFSFIWKYGGKLYFVRSQNEKNHNLVGKIVWEKKVYNKTEVMFVTRKGPIFFTKKNCYFRPNLLTPRRENFSNLRFHVINLRAIKKTTSKWHCKTQLDWTYARIHTKNMKTARISCSKFDILIHREKTTHSP